MGVEAVRGVVLEEVVLKLLENVGYRVVSAGEHGTRSGRSGLEVAGRGEYHQIDAFAAYDHTPAFMYPLRLMVEAKCYQEQHRVGIDVVRNSVGVQKDISENYFTYKNDRLALPQIRAPRFNYQSAIFSTSGYTRGAQRYAIAHQVFLIQYVGVRVLEEVVQGILSLAPDHLAEPAQLRENSRQMSEIRKEIRDILFDRHLDTAPAGQWLTREGRRHVRTEIAHPLLNVQGSYFGMLQGKWPLHLLSELSLPPRAFERRDIVRCRVRSYGHALHWTFSPINYDEDQDGWFELEFDIPEEIASYVEGSFDDPHGLAQVKAQHFSYLDLTGKIGGVHRQVRLELDETWLRHYLERRQRE